MNKISELNLTMDNAQSTICMLRRIKNDTIAFIGDTLGQISIFDATTSVKPQAVLNTYLAEITALNHIANSPNIISGNYRGGICLIDITTQQVLNNFKGHTVEVTCLESLTMNTNLFVSGSTDKNIKIWDVRQKSEIFSIKNKDAKVSCSAISPDEQWIAVGCHEGGVNLLEITTGKVLSEFHSEKIGSKRTNCVLFNPEEFQMVFAGQDRVINYYEMEEFRFQGATQLNPNQINVLKYNTTGTHIYAGGDKFLRIYDTSQNFDLIESVEANWKDVSDLLVTENEVFGICKSGSSALVYKLGLNIESQTDFDNNSIKIKPKSKPDLAEAEENNADLEELIGKHAKINNILENKISVLSNVINLWFVQKNVKSAINSIDKITDPQIISDILNVIIKQKVIPNLSIEMSTFLLKKAMLLLDTKYKSNIQTALTFFNAILSNYTQEIISLKSVNLMTKCDLAREERIKKYDQFLSTFDSIIKNKNFQKINYDLKNSDFGRLSQFLVNDYNYIISAIKR